MKNQTHDETTEDNDNQEQMKPRQRITKEKVGLRPAHQPLLLNTVRRRIFQKSQELSRLKDVIL